jgi:3-deoxy-7-phosphoheptulonate synthase
MVESQELIEDVAINVKKMGAHFLRGGAFKPLSFPYRSEKYNETREQGIEWLISAKEKAGIPIITEVMEEGFVSLVAEAADILQIGTRNMQNYPLLTACAKTGKPIMLKRGYGASLRDWLGAAEYILIEGNEKVLLCERGVSVPHTHRQTSRFLIDLQVIPAAQELTHLPVVVDPSHATFWRPWVKPMSLASIASGADGVMLEVHPDPPNAAVDPLQPIDYKEFNEIMQRMDMVAKASYDRHVLG